MPRAWLIGVVVAVAGSSAGAQTVNVWPRVALTTRACHYAVKQLTRREL